MILKFSKAVLKNETSVKGKYVYLYRKKIKALKKITKAHQVANVGLSLRLKIKTVDCSEDELIRILQVFNSSKDILAIVVPAKGAYKSKKKQNLAKIVKCQKCIP